MAIFFTGETIQNAAGFGLHYVDGKPRWDLTCNSRVSKCLVRKFQFISYFIVDLTNDRA